MCPIQERDLFLTAIPTGPWKNIEPETILYQRTEENILADKLAGVDRIITGIKVLSPDVLAIYSEFRNTTIQSTYYADEVTTLRGEQINHYWNKYFPPSIPHREKRLYTSQIRWKEV